MYYYVWKMNGNNLLIEFFKNMRQFDVNFMYIMTGKLGDIINKALKYCLIEMELIFQKVTLTLVFIVKCIRLYIL